MLKVYSVSLGCPKNRVDTEHLLGSLGMNVQPVEHMGRAQVVFINTCGFIQPAVEESVRTIVESVQHLGRLKRRPLLVVAGCMVGRYGASDLAAELPEVDLWLSTDNLEQWPALLCEKLGHSAPTAPGRLLSTGPSYAWLKISDGCRHACSFCTIPSIRGAHRSTPAATLVAEARQLLDAGVKEIVLVAQDVTAWGHDLPPLHGKEQNLVTLLEQLLPLRGLERLRLLYLYSAGITKELLAFMRQAGPAMLPYFDVPIQHSHSDILSRMGRPFARDPRPVLHRIREALPEAVLRTSLIVGFPGESEEHFAHLQALVEEIRFAHLGVFAYRAEEGTPAALMPDQIADSVKEWRRDLIMEQQADISAAFLAQFDGQRLPILVDAPHPEWPGLHCGRAWFQAPEIDGLTYISGPGVAPGLMVDADIVETKDYDMSALA